MGTLPLAGAPSRNEANASPEVLLGCTGFACVYPLLNTKVPAEDVGLFTLFRIFRKLKPTLSEWAFSVLERVSDQEIVLVVRIVAAGVTESREIAVRVIRPDVHIRERGSCQLAGE